MRSRSEERCKLELTCVSARHRERSLDHPLLVRFDFLIVHRQKDDCRVGPCSFVPIEHRLRAVITTGPRSAPALLFRSRTG